jgi:hypothetical protein
MHWVHDSTAGHKAGGFFCARDAQWGDCDFNGRHGLLHGVAIPAEDYAIAGNHLYNCRFEIPHAGGAFNHGQPCRLWCQRQAVAMISSKSVYLGIHASVSLALAADATSTAGSPGRSATTE